jgi:4-aminobutyrate aminotransferase/(S)-3-amino-2-methylpropionate transaminase
MSRESEAPGYHAGVNETDRAPEILTDIPGPGSLTLARRLARVESRNVTCLDPPPIFWQRASGANVWDVDGNRFVDLTAAFGVANAGHANPEVTRAIARQSRELLHGMGDVHPPAIKVELLEALIDRFPGGVPARAVLSSSGSDAIETAIKTAILATGRPGILAFEGSYHGLSIGALDTTWRTDFRRPFAARLPQSTIFAPFGDLEEMMRAARGSPIPIAAVLIEPIQGRGGEQVPPPGFLSELRRQCTEQGWLLIADEIYTGFGRTGRWFACEHEEVIPDLLCVGKGLASGMPISACLGRDEVMKAWPVSTGEALHTQTFIGHPASCAAALASIRVLEKDDLIGRAERLGERALAHLREVFSSRSGAEAASVVEVRGRGLMLGIECRSGEIAGAACRAALERGVIALPSGGRGEVLSITPPLSIDEEIFLGAIDVLIEGL